MRKKQNENLSKLSEKLKQKENIIKTFHTKVNKEIKQIQQEEKRKSKKQWGIQSQQKKIQNQSQLSSQYSNQRSEQIFTQDDVIINSQKGSWEYHKSKDPIHINICDPNKYYPPSCSGYDITYCKLDASVYIYGGISCQTHLEEGIKTYFYKYQKDKWTELKPQSIYCPIPRYGHTLTSFQRDLILFGGVSQYKEKLKDRCFYSDISLYNTQKNQWRILQTSGNFAKTRKNHASCIFGKYLFIYGGINQNQEVIPQISWINVEQRKPRWKSVPLEARFNHKMISIEMKGKEFLAVFGGRNQSSQIISTLSIIPLSQLEGEITVKQPIKLIHQMSARQMPLMQRFSQGFIILGGNNEDNEVVSDSWYYQAQKQCFQKFELELDFKELRGCQGVSMNTDKIYVLGCNSKKYKALEIQLER